METIEPHKKKRATEPLKKRLAKLRKQIAKNRLIALLADDDGESATTFSDTKPDDWEVRVALKKGKYDDVVIRKQIDEALSKAEAGNDGLLIRLGKQFLRAAEQGDARRLKLYIDEGFPSTWQDLKTGETALHIAAACQAREALRVILKSGTCDFLIRDAQGRLPSEMAYLYGNDPAVARLLGNKERIQAETQGEKLTRTPTSDIIE